ncbi:sensor histidine kinase [Lacinutrix jangbogonensis]|uniref:sensor histidine kinase n=1 Tax=Lacinutrix jangbogonensis TaxID=1469557 RepID=UPI00053E227F|nr:histidine kinase [Lacinutrix jangbogonensis]
MSLQLLFAQQPVSIHLTEKDGLPDNEFYNVLEDSKGYIWLAADKGLFRFDGVNYKKFQHPEQIGLSVFQLKEDENGAVWFINLSGQVFYIQDEKITLFNNYSTGYKGSLPGLKLVNNLLILSNQLKIIIVNIKSKKVVFKDEVNGALYIEPAVYNKTLYYGLNNNLIKLNLVSFEKSSILLKPNSKVVTQHSHSSIFGENLLFYVNDKKGLSFFSTNSKFHSKINKLQHSFPNTRIISVKVIDNKIWYCTKNGVFVCEVQKDNLLIKRHLFPNQFITDIVKDKHANYWFTTVNNGVFVVPNIEINQVSIPLINNKIKNTFKGDENELLISTTNAHLHKYTFPTEKIESYKFVNNINIHLSRHINNNYLVHTNSGTFEFNKVLKNTNVFATDATAKDIKQINSNYIIGAYSNQIRIKNTINNKNIYEKDIRGYTVYYDVKNDLRYFATIKGLLVLNKDLKEVEIKYKNNSIYINAITQTNDGVIWCSSFKSGLFGINDNKVIYHYTESNGLLSNTNRLIKAKNNNIWIAGDKGIQYFNTKENTFKNLTKNEGIVSYNYNGLEIIDDNVFVSSPEHLIYYNEKEVFKPYNTPEVFFTSVNIDNIKQDLKSNYTFKEEARNISIDYSAIGFKTNTSGQFEYRLLGLNNNWIETKNGETNVQYNSLSVGDYTFQIRNVTANKTESKTKQISLLVTKPFWEKLWFYILLGFFFIAIVSVFYRRQMRLKEAEKNKLLKQLEVDKELTNLKLENLRSQMNPHFVFNALNSIQEYILSNQKGLAADYLGKFADLIRTYLEHSSKGQISLEEEVHTLNMYLELEKLRFEDSLNYTIEISNTIDPETINIPTMLIQPYAENALKHGLFHKKENRKLTILISRISNNAIQCIVEDNGVGRKRSNEINKKRAANHKSFALKATTERLDLLNYGNEKKIGVSIIDLLDTNNQPTGTRIVLKIPILKA